jgi:DNA-binding transcriptional LysR family regulator
VPVQRRCRQRGTTDFHYASVGLSPGIAADPGATVSPPHGAAGWDIPAESLLPRLAFRVGVGAPAPLGVRTARVTAARTTPDVVARVHSDDLALALVAQGLGYTLAPLGLADGLRLA